MKNLKKIIIHLLLCYFCFLILNNTAQANNIKNSAVVFMYHKFGKPQYPSTNIDIEIFDQHLEEFSKPKYNVLPVKYILETILNDGELPASGILPSGLNGGKIESCTTGQFLRDMGHSPCEYIGNSERFFLFNGTFIIRYINQSY